MLPRTWDLKADTLVLERCSPNYNLPTTRMTTNGSLIRRIIAAGARDSGIKAAPTRSSRGNALAYTGFGSTFRLAHPKPIFGSI